MNERKTARREPQRRRAPGLTTAWAAVVIALLVIVFFHAVVVGGKTFVSPDATAPAGFARIGEQSLYHEHVYPLWNPYVFLGMPSFASGTYNPLIYPPDWPVAVLQKFLPLPELTWMLIYYFLAGFAMFLLAREWGATATRFGANTNATGTAASSSTRHICRSCCGSQHAGSGAAGCPISPGSRSPADSSSSAATCRSASTPGWR